MASVKTPKGPQNMPAIGDRCKMRGKEAAGQLVRITPDNWAVVRWDGDKPGPRYCHLFELEKI